MDTRHIIRKAGGAAAVARTCGVSSQAVSQWRMVPLEHCPAIEAATGGKVRCEQLRPDVAWVRDSKGTVTGYTVQVKERAA